MKDNSITAELLFRIELYKLNWENKTWSGIFLTFYVKYFLVLFAQVTCSQPYMSFGGYP